MDQLTTPAMDVEDSFEEQVDNTTTVQDTKDFSTMTEDDIWNTDDISSIVFDTKQESNQEQNDVNSLDDVSDETKSQDADHLTNTDVTTKPKEGGLLITNPTLKFKGREIPIDNEEELINLAQKGFKLESEMAKLKPHKRLIDIIESQSLSEEDLIALSDLKQGKKEVMNFFKAKYGIESDEKSDDPYDDLFGRTPKKEEKQVDYKPVVKSDDPVKDYFSEVAQNNPQLSGKVIEIVNDIEPSFYRELYSPEIFPSFVEHVSNGLFDKVYPYALKIRNSNPNLSWLVAYNKGVDIVNNPQNATVKKQAPANVGIPKPSQNTSVRPGADDYARVWEDDEYYNSIKRKLS